MWSECSSRDRPMISSQRDPIHGWIGGRCSFWMKDPCLFDDRGLGARGRCKVAQGPSRAHPKGGTAECVWIPARHLSRSHGA